MVLVAAVVLGACPASDAETHPDAQVDGQATEDSWGSVDGVDGTPEDMIATPHDSNTETEVVPIDTGLDAGPDMDVSDIADTTASTDTIDAAEVTDGSGGETLPTPTVTDMRSRDWSRTGVVRGVWLAPADRPFAPGLRERLDAWARMAQTFVRLEMAREGYLGDTGDGRTFALEVAPDGLWDVVFLQSREPASWFQMQTNGQDAPGAALAEIFAQLPPEAHRDAVVVYFYDTHAVAGRALTHTGQAGSAAPWMGEHAGYALIGAHVLGVGFETMAAIGGSVAQTRLFDDTADSGFDDWDGFGTFRALDRGEWASVYVGAAIHELGHAFGLEHVFDDADGDGVENNVMGHGFRRFGGRFTQRLPQPPTRLGRTSADALAAHPWIR
jgi:hypothetical protein